MILDYLFNYYFNTKLYLFISIIITIIYFFNSKKIFMFTIIISVLSDLLFSRILLKIE